MTEHLPYLLAGVFVAALITWLLMKGRIATLLERLSARDTQLEEGRSNFDNAAGEIEKLRADLREESSLRSAAEEKNVRIPQLEEVITKAEDTNATLRSQNSDLRVNLSEMETRIEEERKASKEKLALLDDARQQLSDAFKALSSEALKSNNQSFMDLAKTTLTSFQEGAHNDLEKRQKAIDEMVKPMKESLASVDSKINDIEKARIEAYSGLTQQVKSLISTQDQLRDETSNLVTALRAPEKRGQWGEMQLHNVVEMAGMVEYCDFREQVSVDDDKGKLRPDMVVKLPNNKTIVVDAKTPLLAYLNALQAPDEESRQKHLAAHASQVRKRINELSLKEYWKQFDSAPDFVVMFLPGESIYSAALQKDPKLIEYGAREQVILATPTTLIALLKAVAYGWRQEQLAENAEKIRDLGTQLYDRIATFANHFQKIGKGIDTSLDAYNKAVGSLERMVLPPAREMKALGVASSKELAQVEGIEKTTRDIQAEELKTLPPSE
jgi:DNA recombination protein RmuC